MKPAALGFRVHSGWAAMVAVSHEGRFPVPVLHDRPHLVRTFTFEFRQPYHTGEKKPFEEARVFIDRVRADAGSLALRVIQSAQANLETRGYELRRCAVLSSSAKPLPDLARILASHPLIHTADGELFREVLVDACHTLALAVLVIKESELLEKAAEALHLPSDEIRTCLTQAGRGQGAPWTQDEKFATLAAGLALV